jgi:hypothetical protein
MSSKARPLALLWQDLIPFQSNIDPGFLAIRALPAYHGSSDCLVFPYLVCRLCNESIPRYVRQVFILQNDDAELVEACGRHFRCLTPRFSSPLCSTWLRSIHLSVHTFMQMLPQYTQVKCLPSVSLLPILWLTTSRQGIL